MAPPIVEASSSFDFYGGLTGPMTLKSQTFQALTVSPVQQEQPGLI
jgi:hypothetical protein